MKNYDVKINNIDSIQLSKQRDDINNVIAECGQYMSDDEYDSLVGIQSLLDAISDSISLQDKA